MPPLAKNIVSCYNLDCPNAHHIKYKAPLKCGRCRTAYYCNKACQRSHWPQHKAFCQNWADTAKNNSEVTVVAIKKKMAHFFWLMRGLLDLNEILLEDYNANRKKGFRGCLEYFFATFEELYEAIEVIESLPVIEEKVFFPLSYEATYEAGPDGRPIGQKVCIRAVDEEHEDAFHKAIRLRLNWLEQPGPGEGRENMLKLLDIVDEDYDNYQFIHRNLSAPPERVVFSDNRSSISTRVAPGG